MSGVFIGQTSSPSNPITLRYRVDGLTESLQGLNNIANTDLVITKKRILERGAKILEYTAQQKVHVITGKTKRSIKTNPATGGGDSIAITAGYGARFEEKRGSPHDFMTQAKQDLATKMIEIIMQEMNAMWGRNKASIPFGSQMF